RGRSTNQASKTASDPKFRKEADGHVCRLRSDAVRADGNELEPRSEGSRGSPDRMGAVPDPHSEVLLRRAGPGRNGAFRVREVGPDHGGGDPEAAAPAHSRRKDRRLDGAIAVHGRATGVAVA